MTSTQLKQLEDQLWKAADQLRANSKLTATEYSFPVLGLIFLRHAYNRYLTVLEEIIPTLPVHKDRGRKPVTQEDFKSKNAMFLPKEAHWQYIADLPEAEDIGERLDQAMRSIEEAHPELADVLPRNYGLFDKDLLFKLVRIFNNESLDGVTGDVFGRIYEYFLNKFAMSGASEGGEFFTPPSLVNTIVRIIEPDHGTVFDPACGSAGMFIQTGHFIEEEGADPTSLVTFYGQEKTDTNTKLAKMNMAVHGLEAKILQGNTFYEDHHNLVGKCDFVMANPPFNVDGVDKQRESVKSDPRLPFGLPKNDNANYLWIQYFYSYLNENGRAGFVMASSASDAGHSEKQMREQLVNTGAVDVMVSIGPKFFYTRGLPCTLWFFDRSKEQDSEWADQSLMLDLREVYRKVSSNLHDFTDEHLTNIQAIVGLYRGVPDHFEQAIKHYSEKIAEGLTQGQQVLKDLKQIKGLTIEVSSLKLDELKSQKRQVVASVKDFTQTLKEELKETKDRSVRLEIQDRMKAAEEQILLFQEWVDQSLHFQREKQWLQTRFPDGAYVDVPGLCKIVTRGEIEANDFSLTPGRYVGVASQINGDFDYESRMAEIKVELQSLNLEATELAQKIQESLIELGI